MQRSRLSRRILLAIWACVLAFGLGVEGSSEALRSYDSCSRICARRCRSHEGCDTYYEGIGVCSYYCMDGHYGEAWFTQ